MLRWLIALAVIASIGMKADAADFRAVMLVPRQLDEARAVSLRAANFNAAVLSISNSDRLTRQSVAQAMHVAQRHELDCLYWIEVARCPELADARPELMASLQGHPEWRRFFPNSPEPRDDEVVKCWPWVPILSREGFEAQFARVTKLLDGLPQPTGVFLNDLQGAPSACGCGHPLCRWTADYGPKLTNTKLGPDAAVTFVERFQAKLPLPQVIPVWATECEAHDIHDLCAGVGCFEGLCWKEFTKQLTPLAARREPIALLTPFRTFDRDLPQYGARAGWVREAIELMGSQPAKHRGSPVAADRLIAVLQGWDVSQREVMAQVAQVRSAGAYGFIVSLVAIDQSWEPRLEKLKTTAP